MAEFDALSARLSHLISERRLAIVCGAGISRASGLPTVADVLEDLFSWLTLSPRARQAISSNALPFERVMELVLGELPFREPFLKLFDLGAPSIFHHFVAALHRKRLIGLIATTNFDRLLERAIDPRADDGTFEVVIEPKDLLTIGEPSTTQLHLVKLHGCVSRPHTIATELYMVGTALLTPARRRAVEWVFQSGPHSHVLVLGYSCSDIFDIVPTLRSLNGGSKTVLFVKHRSGDDSSSTECPESVRSFANWRGVTVNTSQLIERLCNLLRLEEVPGTQVTTALWRPALVEWLDNCVTAAPASRDLAAGALLAAVGFATAAVHRLGHALLVATKDGDSKTIADCHTSLAHVILRYVGTTAKVWNHIQAARDALGNTPAPDEEKRLLHLEAQLNAMDGDFTESAQRFEQILDLCANELERGGSEHELAIVYRKIGKYEQSEMHFRRALYALDAAGHLVSKANAVGDLGNLYVETGNLYAAREQFEEGLELSRLVGDEHGEAVRRANLAALAARIGDADSALSELEESIAAARASGNAVALSSRIGNLGAMRYQRRELELALQHFGEARELARHADNRERELRWITNLGVTLGRLGRTKEAIERLEEAERCLAEMLGTDHPRVHWVRECLALARSQAIDKHVQGHAEGGLITVGPTGLASVSWDTLAP